LSAGTHARNLAAPAAAPQRARIAKSPLELNTQRTRACHQHQRQEGRRPNSPTASCQSANTQESAGGGWNGRGGGGSGSKATGSGGARRAGGPRSTLSVDSTVDDILASGHEHLPACPVDCFADLDRELQRLIRLDGLGAADAAATAAHAAEVGSTNGQARRGGGAGPRGQRGPGQQRAGLQQRAGGSGSSNANGHPRGNAAAVPPSPSTAAAAAAAAAPPAIGRAPRIVIKLPKGLNRTGSGGATATGGAGSSNGGGGGGAAAAAAGLGPANGGVQKRLTLKMSAGLLSMAAAAADVPR